MAVDSSLGGGKVDAGRAVAVGGDCVSVAMTIDSVRGDVTPPGVFVQATETVAAVNSTATASVETHRRSLTSVDILRNSAGNALLYPISPLMSPMRCCSDLSNSAVGGGATWV